MIVFVVGLYKSGTSFITGTVEEMGVPSVVETFRKNVKVQGVKRSYSIFESYEVNLLNNDILTYFSCNEMSMKNLDYNKPLPVEFNNRIKEIYIKNNYNCVIKDPRFIGLLPYWIKVLKSEEYSCIFIERDLLQVENSFKVDKWFLEKIPKSNFREIIEELNQVYRKMLKGLPTKGLQINYDFVNKYKEETYMLIYNYLSKSFKDLDIKKVYFTSYFDSAEGVRELLKRQCPNKVPVWKNIVAVDSKKESDYIIIQDKTQDIIEEKEYSKVLFLGREPKHVPGGYRTWNKECYKNYHHEDQDVWMPQMWWVGLSFDDLLESNPIKLKKLSAIDSGKTLIPGHVKRVDLIKQLEEKELVDVYGKINGKELPYRDKIKGLIDYRYTLSIENGSTTNYFSEKLIDSILCNTYPIYWGCKNISKWFPENSYYWLNMDKPVSYLVDEVKEVIFSERFCIYSEELKEAKNLVLYKYNIWPTIETILNK